MALSCNSTDLLATAYRAGYAKLSERDLLEAGVAAMYALILNSNTGYAQDLINSVQSMGLPKLTQRDLDAIFAALTCSLSG